MEQPNDGHLMVVDIKNTAVLGKEAFLEHQGDALQLQLTVDGRSFFSQKYSVVDTRLVGAAPVEKCVRRRTRLSRTDPHAPRAAVWPAVVRSCTDPHAPRAAVWPATAGHRHTAIARAPTRVTCSARVGAIDADSARVARPSCAWTLTTHPLPAGLASPSRPTRTCTWS